MSKRVYVSREFLEKLLKLAGFEGRRTKLGRWVARRLGERVGREGQVEG